MIDDRRKQNNGIPIVSTTYFEGDRIVISKIKKTDCSKDPDIMDDLLLSTIEDMIDTMTLLRLNLLCNIFIIKHPDSHDFPLRGSSGLLGGMLSSSEDTLKMIKSQITDGKYVANVKPTDEAAVNERLDRIFNGDAEIFDYKVSDLKYFDKMYDYCACMEFAFRRAADKLKEENDKEYQIDKLKDPINIFDIFNNKIAQRDSLVNILLWQTLDMTQKYFELIGYWTHKMENRKRILNGPVAARKKKKKERKNIVRKKYYELKPGDKAEVRKLRRWAQEEFKVTDRAVLFWIQEITSESENPK
jgi:hypothetical protein